MKKFLYLIGVVLCFGFIFTACNNDDDNVYVPDNRAQIYEYSGVTFNYYNDGAGDEYYYFNDTFTLYSGEQTLIYMQSELDSSNNRSWVLLPNNIYYLDGVWYNLWATYEFTMNEFQINVLAGGTIIPPVPLSNINFRVVVIPGIIMNKSAAAPPVDYNDYNAVINYYNIDESKIKHIKK